MNYTTKTRDELISLCKERGVKGFSGKKKADLIALLVSKEGSHVIEHVVEATSVPVAAGPAAFTFIDLFCGIGGFHQALASMGGKCLLACDIDAKCREVYNRNYGIMPAPDVTKLKTEEMPDFDVLCGGFPCQAFSHAGKQGGFEDTRGTLFQDVARILRDKQPRFFLLENVKNLKGHDGGKTWATIYKSLCEAGYLTYEEPHVMSPHHFGIPQHRERVIIMGVRKDLVPSSVLPLQAGRPRSLPPTDIMSILVDDADVPATDVALSVGDIAVLDKWEEFVQHFRGLGVKLPTFPLWSDDWDKTTSLEGIVDWKAAFIQKNRAFYTEHRAFLEPWLAAARTVEGFRGARAKFEWQCGAFEEGDSLWTLLFQFRPSGIRVKRATYSPALVALAQIVVVGTKRRRLCAREVARLQSFPDSFILPAKTGDAYRQFGNAVNVEVIRQAAQQMFALVSASAPAST
jgi:DNA (cytosine-5)-methyltransferase 1